MGQPSWPYSPSPLLVILLPPRGVVVQRVQPLRAFPPEVELTVRRLFRVLGQLALEVLPPALVAGLLDIALQLAQLPLLPVHAPPSYALMMSRTVAPPGIIGSTCSWYGTSTSSTYGTLLWSISSRASSRSSLRDTCRAPQRKPFASVTKSGYGSWSWPAPRYVCARLLS